MARVGREVTRKVLSYRLLWLRFPGNGKQGKATFAAIAPCRQASSCADRLAHARGTPCGLALSQGSLSVLLLLI